MRSVLYLLGGLGLWLCAAVMPGTIFGDGRAFAQYEPSIERIVVTGSRIEQRIPGVTLTKRADFLLLELRLVNDSLDRRRRLDELQQTLETVFEAATRDPLVDVSVIDDEGFVLPFDPNSSEVSIEEDRSRRDTSFLSIQIKTRIPPEDADSQALVRRLTDFASGIEPVGRTLVDVTRDVELSIVNPDQYRRQLIRLIADDIAFARETFGEGMTVQVFGLSDPVMWHQAGLIDVSVFIPYSYTLVPDTLTSFTYLDYED